MRLKNKKNDLEKLIEECIRQDRKAQEAFYNRFFGFAHGIVIPYTQNDDELLQIINNGFLKIFNNLHKLESSFALTRWMSTIFQREVSNYFSVKRNTFSFQEINDNELTEQRNLIELEFEEAAISRLLDVLPEMTKEVFKSYFMEGYKHKEISDKLSIPLGTVKWHYSQAKKILKTQLEKAKKIQVN